jgi:hypothetical protein
MANKLPSRRKFDQKGKEQYSHAQDDDRYIQGDDLSRQVRRLRLQKMDLCLQEVELMLHSSPLLTQGRRNVVQPRARDAPASCLVSGTSSTLPGLLLAEAFKGWHLRSLG